MTDKVAETQLAGFIAKYTPEIGAIAKAALKKMRSRLPGSIEMVYDNFSKTASTTAMREFRFTALLLVLAISANACIFISQRPQVQQIQPREAVTVTTPVKAHLKDGSTIVYLRGVSIVGGMLRGSGVRYDLKLTQTGSVDDLPVESLVGMESFSMRVNRPESAIVSTLATVGVVLGTAALLKAIFGSCPTVYTADGQVEEAELFSSSIAPLFEGRDMDRLRAQPDADGTLKLELRNEAMETHYINHLSLVEVQHQPDEFVLPDEQGHPVAVRDIRVPSTIKNRNGDDLRSTLTAADDRFYKADRRIIDRATAADMNDWIDLTATVPAGSETATLVFRLRNSLLSTILLYDVMLAPAGGAAIDWLGVGLSRIDNAVELGMWHRKRAGLHISVWENGGYREVARIPDSGPISWHDVAAVIPVPPDQREQTTLRLRLSFIADHWRIDRVGIASSVREMTPRSIEIGSVAGSDGKTESEARENLSAPDVRYLQTNPGQRFFAYFDVGRDSEKSRTFLLSSQGYYTEWIRGSWIHNASAAKPFAPGDEALLVALRKWSSTRDSFEKRFMTSRVPAAR